MGTHPIFESDFDCLTEMSSEEEEFEVDMIINDRIEKGEEQYLIRWKNYGPNDDTWEPESNLDCPEIIAAYKEQKKIENENKKNKDNNQLVTNIRKNKINDKRSKSPEASNKKKKKE